MRAGDTIADRFELRFAAGSGGMGTVFRARDRLTGDDVALKVMRGLEADGLARFARETNALAQLHHASVVRYVAHGATRAGEAWLAMEWLEGEDLGHILRRRGESANTLVSGGAGSFTPHLPIVDSIAIARRLAAALTEIHRNGLVYRDLKPANVMLVDGDPTRATLVDFGTCRPNEPHLRVTRTGVLVGTPLYMAPEQARAQSTIGSGADVWALGCLLYEMLCGIPPFHGDHVVAVLAKIALEQPPSVVTLRQDVPEAVEALLRRLLAKEASERPSAAEAELELATIEEHVGASTVGPRARRGAVGRSEQRFHAVLFSGPRPASEDASWLTRVRRVLVPFGGALTPLAGDAFVASFTSTQAQASELAEVAARAAIAIQDQIPELSLAISCERTDHDSSQGDVFDHAARALRDAGAGRITVGSVAASLLERRFVLASRGNVAELVGLRDKGQPARTLLGRPTECVGRDRELAWFEGLFEECVEEPRARVAFVTGPAGIGKSRLRHELVRRIERSRPTARVFFAAADALAAGAPYGLLAPAVRRAAGIVDEEPLERKRSKLEALVARSVPERGRARVSAYLGELASVPFSREHHPPLGLARREPLLLGDSMAAAFETFFASECAQEPVVLVLEDVHWGDLPSLSLVDSILRTLADRPLFVVVTARPEVHALFPSLFATRGAQELRLEGLSRRASERLVREALPNAAVETIARVVSRADGNPLFLEELIRSVVERRSNELPDTVLGVLESRLEALGEEARRVLRAASVFGESFALEGVVELLGGDVSHGDVRRILDVLVTKEVISHRRRDRSSREGEYLFRHALVRDAAYATLPEADRLVAHEAAAIHLERLEGSSSLAIAEHFVRGGTELRSVPHFLRAAEEALEGNNLTQAIARAKRGIALGAEESVRGELEAIVTAASYWQGGYRETVASADRALLTLPRGSATAFRVLGDAAGAAGRMGDRERLVQLLRRVDRTSDDGTTAAREARLVAMSRGTLQAMVSGVYTGSECDEALERLERLAGDERSLAPTTVAQLHSVRGVRASVEGDVVAFLEHTKATIDAFARAGDERNVALESPTIAWCLVQLGQHREALDVARDAYARAKRLGLDHAMSHACSSLGLALSVSGREGEARAAFDEAIAHCRTGNNQRMIGYVLGHRATVANQTGHPDVALREATEAEPLVRAAPGFHTWVKAERARALLALGRVREALEEAQTANAMLERLGGILMQETTVPLVFAEALFANGARDEAREAIRGARDRVLRLAARIPAELLEGFLAIPDNARILALATRWLEESASVRRVLPPFAPHDGKLTRSR